MLGAGMGFAVGGVEMNATPLRFPPNSDPRKEHAGQGTNLGGKKGRWMNAMRDDDQVCGMPAEAGNAVLAGAGNCGQAGVEGNPERHVCGWCLEAGEGKLLTVNGALVLSSHVACHLEALGIRVADVLLAEPCRSVYTEMD
jgi:hypothetical protein